MKITAQSTGFTLMEFLLTLMITTVFVMLALAYGTSINKNTTLARSIATKDRIVMGLRDMASLPATIRTSMRVATAGTMTPVNPELLACGGANPFNSCKSGEEFPFAMYSPFFQRNPVDGSILGAQPVTARKGSTTPMRLNTFGAPCTTVDSNCALLVFTSFKAQCPPAVSAVPATSPADLAPKPTCSIAEVIEVTYYIELDPAVADINPDLKSFLTPVQGTVAVSGTAISGNYPQ